MQLLGRLEISSAEKISEILGEEHTGRLATIDASGHPQVIPMNFALLDGAIYMHSHTRGEKLDNIARDARAGFEVDREYEFLPSYYADERDASLADTLYASVVIKGTASVVEGEAEKCRALNALMSKYQPEGRYEPVREGDPVLGEVAVIKVVPSSMRGKYKIGQHLRAGERAELARKILERRGEAARATLRVMGFEVRDGKAHMVEEPRW